jgi:hypothetical protein
VYVGSRSVLPALNSLDVTSTSGCTMMDRDHVRR